MNVRRDKTQLNKQARADWELNAWQDDAMSARDEETQQAIVEGWKSIWNSGDQAKIEEMELARRISAAAEDDTLEKRVAEVIKEVKVAGKVEQALQDLQQSGQSVEEFEMETDAFGRKYRQIVTKARREVGL